VNNIFVDTSGWANFFFRSEPFHQASVDILSRLRRERGVAVTTNYVITELVALLTSPLNVSRQRQIEVLDAVTTAPWVKLIHIGPETDLRARDLLRSRLDKTWSLVDCSSFVIMSDLGVTQALTNDAHFDQAGFRRLLLPH